jgi:hypothetical protein
MSLNRTLTRLFDEVRREAKRNPRFADRLDAIIGAHSSNRSIPDDLDAAIAEIAPAAAPPPAPATAKRATTREPPPLTLNPIALYTRDGADAVRATLLSEDWPLPALRALVSEHHLDPAGIAAKLDKPALVDHVVAQAKKRIERDKKLFDY